MQVTMKMWPTRRYGPGVMAVADAGGAAAAGGDVVGALASAAGVQCRPHRDVRDEDTAAAAAALAVTDAARHRRRRSMCGAGRQWDGVKRGEGRGGGRRPRCICDVRVCVGPRGLARRAEERIAIGRGGWVEKAGEDDKTVCQPALHGSCPSNAPESVDGGSVCSWRRAQRDHRGALASTSHTAGSQQH